MVIQSDALGNQFLGDAIYANHNLAFPTVNFLKGYPLDDLSAELSLLLAATTIKSRNVIPQIDIDNRVSFKSLVALGTNSDTIDDRVSIEVNQWNGASGFTYNVAQYNNSGFVNTNNNGNSATNRVSFATNRDTDSPNNSRGLNFNESANHSPLNALAIASPEMFALMIFNTDLSLQRINMNWWYFGTVDAVNTNFTYYNADIPSQTIIMGGHYEEAFTTQSGTCGRHYIASTSSRTLISGDAIYPITCTDLQTPSGKFATDAYVFDDNATIGFPAIGKLRNVLLADSTFQIGQPETIIGGVTPDIGSNVWMPVGMYAGKTLLIRVYSSEVP